MTKVERGVLAALSKSWRDDARRIRSALVGEFADVVTDGTLMGCRIEVRALEANADALDATLKRLR